MINTKVTVAVAIARAAKIETRGHRAVSLLIIQRITRVPTSTEAAA